MRGGRRPGRGFPLRPNRPSYVNHRNRGGIADSAVLSVDSSFVCSGGMCTTFAQSFPSVQADLFAEGDRPVSSSSVTMSCTSTCLLTLTTTTSGTAVLEVDSDWAADSEVQVWSRYIGEGQAVFVVDTSLTINQANPTGSALLLTTSFLVLGNDRPTATLQPSFTLLENGDCGTYVGGTGSSTSIVTEEPSDNVDVPFEATTGIRVATEAVLSFAIGEYEIKSAERDLLRVSPQMKAPVFVNGRPYHPDFPISVPTSMTVSAIVKPKPIPASDPPSTGENHGNKTPTHRWLAKDFPYAYGEYGENWPAHGGNGPTWNSVFPYRPRREQFEGTVDYDDVLVFWWHYVEHMWANFNHTQPFTFIITGILHGGTAKQHHHLLDRTNNTPTPFYDTPNGASGSFDEGSNRNFVHIRPTQIQQAAPNIYTGKSTLHHKAAIYSATFSGSNSYVDVHMQGYQQRVKGNPGTDGIDLALLGRQHGWVSPFHASHMSLLEVDFFNYSLEDDEMKEIHKHLFALYELHKW